MSLLRDKPHPPRSMAPLPYEQCVICGKSLGDPIHDMSLRTDGIFSEVVTNEPQLLFSSVEWDECGGTICVRNQWGW